METLPFFRYSFSKFNDFELQKVTPLGDNNMFLLYLGQELTYKGHAGLGRPVPAPFFGAKQHIATPVAVAAPPYLTSSPKGDSLIPTIPASAQGAFPASPPPPAPGTSRHHQGSTGLSPSPPPPGSQLIQPRKVRGTPTMYADLQFPTSSNNGSMKRRRLTSRERETDYVRIKFNPARAEQAEL